MFTNYKEARAYCEASGIEMIDFKMVDLWGRWRHLTIPIQRFRPEVMTHGIGFDGSNYGYAPVERSDMVFIPDLTTAVREPFSAVPTLNMLGDVLVIDKENRPFDQYPRNVLKKAVEYLKETGLADEMHILPEFEFFIFDHVSSTVQPQESSYRVDMDHAIWNSGRNDVKNLGYHVAKHGGYHVDAPLDHDYELRSKICQTLENMGIEVKYHHMEVAGGQMEIEPEIGPVCEMADNIMMIKYVVKNMAMAAGKTATFMPKPIYDEAGSGLHVHMLLKKNGYPIFYDEDGYSGLSKKALNFIGGILTHARSLCALTNPSTNSFKRLVPGYEAPVSLVYATANRSAVIRIPSYAKTPNTKRFELRCPDATCNPYYALAAILMAGIDGMQREIDPVAEGFGPYDCNLYKLSKEEQSKIKGLPTSLEEACLALETDNDYLKAGGVFPQRLLEVWNERRLEEARRINSIPHPAEFNMYYDL